MVTNLGRGSSFTAYLYFVYLLNLELNDHNFNEVILIFRLMTSYCCQNLRDTKCAQQRTNKFNVRKSCSIK